ncbi:PAS domain S-box protein [Sediminicola arcticus]|jgi:PAS domain S-box-containing protein|uniref:histidine kinase n=1 Tax=Sediminicola arcticus TaxID=1574308 RepID=A0ABV2SS04_9FLAO
MEHQLSDTTVLQSIYEATSDGILFVDAKRRIWKVNKAAHQILGYTASELEQKKLEELLSKPTLAILDKLFSEEKQTHDVKILETTVYALNGPQDVQIRIIPQDKGGCILLLGTIFWNGDYINMLKVRNMALESTSNGITITDARLPDLPIIYCNQGFVRMTGYSKEEILNKNCRFLQADDRDQKEIGIIKSAIQKGDPCRVVLRNYKKNGTLFWNELNITPVRDEANELSYFIGVQNDVTLTKKEELTKDHIRYILEMITKVTPIEKIGQEIINVMKEYVAHSIPIIGHMDRGKYNWQYLEKGNGYGQVIETIASLILESIFDTKSERPMYSKEVVIEDISKIKATTSLQSLALKLGILGCWYFPILSSKNEVLGCLLLFNRRYGKPEGHQKELLTDMVKLASIAFEHHKNNYALQQGKKQLMELAKKLEYRVMERTKEVTANVRKLVELNLNLEDQVKETKEAENKASQSQVMLSAIAQNFPKGAMVVFNENFEIVYIEGEELRHINMIKEEVEGRSIGEIPFFSEHHILKMKKDIKETVKGNKISFEMGFEKKIYSVNSRPLYDAYNDCTLALFVYNNITQQKLVEREIRYALKREQELNDLKTRFVSMASHEFRTPLSAILSSAILIYKQNEPGNETKIERYVERIKSNVRNLVVILNDFLSLDKLEAGKVGVNRQLFDLIQFSKALIEEMDSNKKMGQTIVLEKIEQEMLVFIDPKLLSHILINLLSNAIKYSDENMDIILNIQNTGSHVVIKITDNGIGIPIKEQEHLFERFFRAENALNIQGTGLGLHIVRQYVELLGGTVGFKGELGKESIFTVKLPTNLEENENNIDH